MVYVNEVYMRLHKVCTRCHNGMSRCCNKGVCMYKMYSKMKCRCYIGRVFIYWILEHVVYNLLSLVKFLPLFFIIKGTKTPKGSFIDCLEHQQIDR